MSQPLFSITDLERAEDAVYQIARSIHEDKWIDIPSEEQKPREVRTRNNRILFVYEGGRA